MTAAASGNNKLDEMREAEELPVVLMENTLLKDMSDELKQFVSLTSATSLGSAKVMSTHYFKDQ